MVLLPTGPTHARIGKPGGDTGYFGSTLTPRNFSAVTAAAMLVRANVFDSLRGFDVTFARDYNDVDFCLRAGATGHRVAWTPYAHFIHHEGVSIVRRVPDPTEQRIFTERWADALARDPYYSPALHASIERLYEPR
jgi:GT2 family glycosyltransferase